MKARAVVGLALAAGLAAGCAANGGGARGHTGHPAAAARSSGASPAPLSPVASACGAPDAPGRLITIRTADGVRLAAAAAGSGPRGVVLIPELGRAGKCGWWDYAAYLSRSGFQVVIFDHRCTGESGCPARTSANGLMADIRAAVAWLRRDGARKVALVGGSQGASEALIAGTAPPPGVTGVVALSADELTMRLAGHPYPRTAVAAAPGLRLPVLFAVAANDPYVSVPDTRRLERRAGSADKRLIVLPPAAGHGWDLVSVLPPATHRPTLAGVVRAFLARVTA